MLAIYCSLTEYIRMDFINRIPLHALEYRSRRTSTRITLYAAEQKRCHRVDLQVFDPHTGTRLVGVLHTIALFCHAILPFIYALHTHESCTPNKYVCILLHACSMGYGSCITPYILQYTPYYPVTI